MSNYTIHDVEQGSPEWHELRAGRVTASLASKLMTPLGKPSTQFKKEIGRVIAERKGWQRPVPFQPTYWMERGKELEGEARGWFQVETGLYVRQVGFIEHHTGLAGFSPDGMTEENGILIPSEFKVPMPSTHIEWLREGGVPKDHLPQCHFALALTDAPYMRFMSYHPEAPCIVEVVERNKLTETMVACLDDFYEEFNSAWRDIFGEDYFKSETSNEEKS